MMMMLMMLMEVESKVNNLSSCDGSQFCETRKRTPRCMSCTSKAIRAAQRFDLAKERSHTTPCGIVKSWMLVGLTVPRALLSPCNTLEL